MSSTALSDTAVSERAHEQGRRLFVAWQDPASRAIEPVGVLSRRVDGDEPIFEYRYLRRAADLAGFRPFVGFPELAGRYRSADLFPFFENRVMPRSRDDYRGFMAQLGLPDQADPFEVLALTQGRRQTDTIEVFPEPVLIDGTLACRFLVHGVRHAPGANDAIDSLATGDRLCVMPDPQNEVDACAVLLRDGDYHLLGWVPRYLTTLVHVPLATGGTDAVEVTVEHIGDRQGPTHLRLLCHLTARWPVTRDLPFTGPDFETLAA